MAMFFIKDNNNYWSVSVNGSAHHFDPSHPQYETLVECIRQGDTDKFIQNIDIEPVINKWGDGDFVCTGGVITYKGEELHEIITERIFDLIEQRLPHTPLLNFVKNLFDNPSFRSVEQLYTFLEHKQLPITPDGHFTAYKYVTIYTSEHEREDLNGIKLNKGDFVDCRTGESHRNNVGDKPHMPRNKVDDNLNNACGAGLHVGSYNFVNCRNNIVVCKINPADVVSIPISDSCQKVRCCAYEVISVLNSDDKDCKPTDSAVVDNNYSDWSPDDNEDEDDYDCDSCGCNEAYCDCDCD